MQQHPFLNQSDLHFPLSVHTMTICMLKISLVVWLKSVSRLPWVLYYDEGGAWWFGIIRKWHKEK